MINNTEKFFNFIKSHGSMKLFIFVVWNCRHLSLSKQNNIIMS